jgi:hypothetical protein
MVKAFSGLPGLQVIRQPSWQLQGAGAAYSDN